MCTCVWLESEKSALESQGEFAAYLGVGLSDLVINEGYAQEELGEGWCLCPVDVTKMLDAAGKHWRFNDMDPMEIIVI
jgi:hypothetical protein